MLALVPVPGGTGDGSGVSGSRMHAYSLVPVVEPCSANFSSFGQSSSDPHGLVSSYCIGPALISFLQFWTDGVDIKIVIVAMLVGGIVSVEADLGLR